MILPSKMWFLYTDILRHKGPGFDLPTRTISSPFPCCASLIAAGILGFFTPVFLPYKGMCPRCSEEALDTCGGPGRGQGSGTLLSRIPEAEGGDQEEERARLVLRLGRGPRAWERGRGRLGIPAQACSAVPGPEGPASWDQACLRDQLARVSHTRSVQSKLSSLSGTSGEDNAFHSTISTKGLKCLRNNKLQPLTPLH